MVVSGARVRCQDLGPQASRLLDHPEQVLLLRVLQGNVVGGVYTGHHWSSCPAHARRHVLYIQVGSPPPPPPHTQVVMYYTNVIMSLISLVALSLPPSPQVAMTHTRRHVPHTHVVMSHTHTSSCLTHVVTSCPTHTSSCPTHVVTSCPTHTSSCPTHVVTSCPTHTRRHVPHTSSRHVPHTHVVMSHTRRHVMS